MKFKATKKAMKDNYHYIISIGYCNAYYLLRDEKPIAYSAGVYGWQCDYYDVDGVLISTGYNTLNNKNTYADYEIINEYETKAEKIISNKEINYETQKQQVKALLKEFIKNAKTKK